MLYVKSVHKKSDVIKILDYWTYMVSVWNLFVMLCSFFSFFAATLQNNCKWFALKKCSTPSSPSGLIQYIINSIYCEMFCIWHALCCISILDLLCLKAENSTAHTVFSSNRRAFNLSRFSYYHSNQRSVLCPLALVLMCFVSSRHRMFVKKQ